MCHPSSRLPFLIPRRLDLLQDRVNRLPGQSQLLGHVRNRVTGDLGSVASRPALDRADLLRRDLVALAPGPAAVPAHRQDQFQSLQVSEQLLGELLAVRVGSLR